MNDPQSAIPSLEDVRLFLSYGRADAGELAERLESDLSLLSFEVWRDRRKIRSGKEWDDEIEAGLRASQLVVAVLTPHAAREESVCRDELAFARFACKLPIVPALTEPCEPPFVIFRLDDIDLTDWLTESQDPRPSGRFFVSTRRGHERLAACCWAEYRRGAEKMSLYALRHLPSHLIESARWDDLGGLLRDLPFLEAKAEAGDVFDLAMGYGNDS